MSRVVTFDDGPRVVTPLTRDTFCALGIHSTGCGCGEQRFPVSRPGHDRVVMLDRNATLAALRDGGTLLPASWARYAEDEA